MAIYGKSRYIADETILFEKGKKVAHKVLKQ